jgi:predicted Fe-Mo cluster-binding NifX family protein
MPVFGVEVEFYPAMAQRLAGKPVQVGGPTIAEGIAVRDVGETPLTILKKLGVEVLVVPERAVEQAIVLLAEGAKVLAEGAGELLKNMLRAARLAEGAQVWLATLQRSAGPADVLGLDEVLAHTEPDVVFLMSRLGAQALLETDEPLGRLRGQVHDLWGLPAVVSYDLGSLLRTPTEKAKAWDDLCLAMDTMDALRREPSAPAA